MNITTYILACGLTAGKTYLMEPTGEQESFLLFISNHKSLSLSSHIWFGVPAISLYKRYYISNCNRVT